MCSALWFYEAIAYDRNTIALQYHVIVIYSIKSLDYLAVFEYHMIVQPYTIIAYWHIVLCYSMTCHENRSPYIPMTLPKNIITVILYDNMVMILGSSSTSVTKFLWSHFYKRCARTCVGGITPAGFRNTPASTSFCHTLPCSSLATRDTEGCLRKHTPRIASTIIVENV